MKFTVDAKYEKALLDTLLYIDAHLAEPLSLQALARRAGFSPYHFHRVFTEWVGERVKEYIRRLRLERAAYRLKISDVPLLELALDSGFKTHETFTRAFAKHFGINPGQYRSNFLLAARQRRNRPLREIVAPGLAAAVELEGQPAVRGTMRLECLRPITVAFVRHIGVYEGLLEPGSELADYWKELFRWGETTKLASPASLLIGIPQDDPTVTPADKTRFDVGIQVPAFCNPTRNVECQTLAGGLYGVARHYGPFSQLTDTYIALYENYIARGKYQLRIAPPFEVYGNTRVRDNLQIHHTDIYLPLQCDQRSP